MAGRLERAYVAAAVRGVLQRGADVTADKPLVANPSRCVARFEPSRRGQAATTAWRDETMAGEGGRPLAETAPKKTSRIQEREMQGEMTEAQGECAGSVRSLAAGVAKADLTAFNTQDITNLLYARSMFLALSIHQAVSSGHSQLARVMVNKAVFNQLGSDSERAAFMREQVRASLPEAEAWRQLLQAGGGHCAGQVEAPAPAPPAAQQQQAVSVSAGQQARQQGALPAAQAKSAGALPSQRAGQAPGLLPRPVRPRSTVKASDAAHATGAAWEVTAAGQLTTGLQSSAEVQASSCKRMVVALRQYDQAPRPKQDLQELVSAVEELPFLSSSSQVEQTSQLLWCFADWARQPENSRARMTQAQCNAVLALLQRMDGDGKTAEPMVVHYTAKQLSLSAWSLGKLRPHLPAAAVTSACTALASHSASSEAMTRVSWRDWSTLLHGLATAGMQCSSSPDMTWLCKQAVQLLPGRLVRGAVGQDISMTLWAMAKSGYTGNAQPLLQSVTAAMKQGEVMRDAKPQNWANLIWATSKLPGCREEARQLLTLFAARAQAVVPDLNAQEVSNVLYAMGMVLWHDKVVCRLLAERAAQTQKVMNGQAMTNSLYGLARLNYLDSSVRSQAAGVAKADLTAFTAQAITNLLYARSMFLALSIHQAVSSGHSQLASEPQLNSMAAALWRECSRRGQSEELRVEEDLNQLYAASQWLDACTGGQMSLTASPALQELVANAKACKKVTIYKLQTVLTSDYSQLVQALVAAGHAEVQQAVLSKDGTHCTQLLVQGPGLTRGISVEESPNFLPDGRMSGVVAHAKLQQLTHFDAGVVVNKAVFDQLASDSERAAFMREQVRASLPEAEAWRQLLQAVGGHCAGQVEAPAAATPAAQQQQAVSVSAGQQARQQGALPLPAAQAKSAGALPSQRAGQAPGLMPRPVRPKACVVWSSVEVHALRQYDLPPRLKQDLQELVSAVEELPFLSSSSQVEQTSQLLWCFADWARQPENSRARMTQAQCNAMMALLQRMAVEAQAGTAGNPPALPPLQQFDARQLGMAGWSLGKLKPHLPPSAVTSACTAIARHSASSEAMKRGSWRNWSNLLHGLATAGMQCSSSPDLTWLCDQAVQLLPYKLAWGAASQNISMTLWAMTKSGYTGSAQPLLQSVTAAISQGEVMRDANPQNWANLIWATSKLPGCMEEARQLLSQFAARAQAVVPALKAQEVSNILYAMGMVLWHDKEVCRQLAERAAQTQKTMNSQNMANSLYALARLGYLDSSVRSLAAGVAKADLAAFTTQAITNLLYARSMFLALSILQAVSSGHSQLVSEPQLNSMAAALWRECSRRGQGVELWGEENLTQLYKASQWLHVCTGGLLSLAAAPALQELIARATAHEIHNTKKVQNAARQVDCCQLVQALAAAGYGEVQQASVSQIGTLCTLLRVGMEMGLTQGIAVDQISLTLHDGSMSGVVAHARLQQLTHFDAGVMVNKAVFDQLASDSERAAFMREQVRASLPEAEAWRQLLQAEGEH
ncbi:hypothetical protein QJQ45_013414 [Haematococcus lacustris]|nr:hypothetical protein QJQ45_013414 [Haematococcus lacustris]